jgi:hypothetical protein
MVNLNFSNSCRVPVSGTPHFAVFIPASLSNSVANFVSYGAKPDVNAAEVNPIVTVKIGHISLIETPNAVRKNRIPHPVDNTCAACIRLDVKPELCVPPK